MNNFASSFIRNCHRFVLMSLLLLSLIGCSGGGGPVGQLRAISLGDSPVELGATYITAVYSHDPSGDTSFFLSDVPMKQLLKGNVTQGQIMHIELLWVPKAGATPMDSSATNASIRHIIISDGEVGVYGGAGFAMPRGKPGAETLTVALRDATMRLLESTDGFADLLSPAQITGTFTAELDAKTARKVHRAVSQLVTNALGRSRFVDAGDDALSTNEEVAPLFLSEEEAG